MITHERLGSSCHLTLVFRENLFFFFFFPTPFLRDCAIIPSGNSQFFLKKKMCAYNVQCIHLSTLNFAVCLKWGKPVTEHSTLLILFLTQRLCLPVFVWWQMFALSTYLLVRCVREAGSFLISFFLLFYWVGCAVQKKKKKKKSSVTYVRLQSFVFPYFSVFIVLSTPIGVCV